MKTKIIIKNVQWDIEKEYLNEKTSPNNEYSVNLVHFHVLTNAEIRENCKAWLKSVFGDYDVTFDYELG